MRGFLAGFLFKTNTANEDKFAPSPVSIMAWKGPLFSMIFTCPTKLSKDRQVDQAATDEDAFCSLRKGQ